VAGAALPVLVLGETGTGKERVARTVHRLSGRSGPLVAVNCGALPATLIESELFGFKRGAFSGATEDRAGLVRASSGGTLFLDEIAELPDSAQAALLRVVQEREVVPIGSTAPVAVDLRVVAATHQDLAAACTAGRFRQDLHARLAGAVVRIPPLRSRLEDLGLLMATILTELDAARAPRVTLGRNAARALFAHGWPYNVRELRLALELALSITDGDDLDEIELEEAPPADAAESVAAAREHLEAALRAEHGNVSAAARAAGYSRAHFHRLMKRWSLDPADFRD
jgi:DNA-binding NtrC family response regulator